LGQPAKKLSPAAVEAELRDDIAGFQHDPAGFVWYAFPWGVPGTPLAGKRPRKWFLELCERIAGKLRANGTNDVWQVVQEAVASGHGIGKSAAMAQLVLWAMSTFEDTKGVITANTENQLRTKTWPELVKWHGLCITKHWFNVTATAIHHVINDRTWRVDAVPWTAHNTEAFAGLHNEGRRIILGMDEASATADPVWETAEGAMTDAKTEILWFAFGNPTRSTGRFRQCFTKHRELWGAVNVDSRTVDGVNLDRIARWARIYGEDSQFFNVRVRGQFVEADANQLIPLEWIAMARQRGSLPYGDGSLPRRRISGDIAAGGADDTVLTSAIHYATQRVIVRQNKFSFRPATAVTDSADAIKHMWEGFGCDVNRGDDIVVDSLGVGAGAASYLVKNHNLPVVIYKGGESASNPALFRNRRVQSYIALRNDFRDGRIVLLPDMLPDESAWSEFEAQLCSIKSKPGTDRLEDLQTRAEMNREGIDSPDYADSLAMQYATQTPTTLSVAGHAGNEWMPLAAPPEFFKDYTETY
jgi:hypothetical protein